MRHRSLPLAIIFISTASLVVLVDHLIPPDTITYPTDIKTSVPVRRSQNAKKALPSDVERFLPREGSNDLISSASALPEIPLQLQGALDSNPAILESAKNYLESQGNSEEAQKAVVNRGFQQFLGRAPMGSEEQAGLQALREVLSH